MSAIARLLCQCFMIIASIGFLDNYKINFGEVVVLKGPIKVQSMTLRNIAVKSITLPRHITAVYKGDTVVIDTVKRSEPPDDGSSESDSQQLSTSTTTTLAPEDDDSNCLRAVVRTRAGFVSMDANVKICGRLHLIRNTTKQTDQDCEDCYAATYSVGSECKLLAYVQAKYFNLPATDICQKIHPKSLEGLVALVKHPNVSYPEPQPGDTPVQDVSLFSAISKVLPYVDDVLGVHAGVSFPVESNGTGAHLQVGYKPSVSLNDARISIENVTKTMNALPEELKLFLRDILSIISEDTGLEDLNQLVDAGKATNGPIAMDILVSKAYIPEGFAFDVYLGFDGLQCNPETGLDCTFPSAGALSVRHIGVSGLGDVDLATYVFSSVVSRASTRLLDRVLPKACAYPPVEAEEEESSSMEPTLTTTSPTCAFTNTSYVDRKPTFPALRPDASPNTDSRVASAITAIATNAAKTEGVELYGDSPTDTALQVGVTIRGSKGLHTLKNMGLKSLLEKLAKTLPKPTVAVTNSVLTSSNFKFTELNPIDILLFLPDIIAGTHLSPNITDAIGNYLDNLPNGGGLTFGAAVSVNDLKCNPDGYTCSLPAADAGALNLLSVRGDPLLDSIVSFYSPMVEPAVTKLIDAVLPMFPPCKNTVTDSHGNTEQRCVATVPNKQPTTWPKLVLLILLPIASVVLTVLLILLDVFRHRKGDLRYVKTHQRVPTWVIVLQDAILGILLFSATTCFICSNVSTVATVTIGGQLSMYAFSLMNTVESLWGSGLKPLAIFVMVFSGIYPYIKIAGIILFTFVLHRPHSRVLAVIDVIGKFSFVDPFVMLIMVSGLSVPGIADAQILPSFFFFVVGTVLSILAGNFATVFWRRGTTMRVRPLPGDKKSSSSHNNNNNGTPGDEKTDSSANEPFDSAGTPQKNREPAAYAETGEDDNSEPVLGENFGSPTLTAVPMKEHTGVEVGSPTSPVRRDKAPRGIVHTVFRVLVNYLKGVWWPVSIPIFAAMFGLTLPSWVRCSISYKITGAAHIVAGPPKRYNLYQLATSSDAVCAVLAIITVLCAPFIFAILYQEACTAAAWTAADVLLLACVAGLVQLNQFVQFILGGDFDAIFAAHATLHWPLIPLLIAAVLVWAMQIFHLAGGREKMSRVYHAYKARKEEERKERPL